MKTLLLGQSDLRVSQLCLGTMTFGEDWEWGTNRDISRQIFDRFAEVGVVESELADSITDPGARAAMQEFRRIALSADAIARAIGYAIAQSADVDVSEIIVRPTASSN